MLNGREYRSGEVVINKCVYKIDRTHWLIITSMKILGCTNIHGDGMRLLDFFRHNLYRYVSQITTTNAHIHQIITPNNASLYSSGHLGELDVIQMFL